MRLFSPSVVPVLHYLLPDWADRSCSSGSCLYFNFQPFSHVFYTITDLRADIWHFASWHCPFTSSAPGASRLEEEIARMKKNQERRLHRKNAKIAKEGGTPMTLNRPVKPDTTVSTICRNAAVYLVVGLGLIGVRL